MKPKARAVEGLMIDDFNLLYLETFVLKLRCILMHFSEVRMESCDSSPTSTRGLFFVWGQGTKVFHGE